MQPWKACIYTEWDDLGHEKQTQWDGVKDTVWQKSCVEIFSPSKKMHDGVAGGNSRRENDSQPADVPQGIVKSEMGGVKEKPV